MRSIKAYHLFAQMTLVRKGIELILLQVKEDVISTTFRREVDALLSHDRELLKRLAKA